MRGGAGEAVPLPLLPPLPPSPALTGGPGRAAGKCCRRPPLPPAASGVGRKPGDTAEQRLRLNWWGEEGEGSVSRVVACGFPRPASRACQSWSRQGAAGAPQSWRSARASERRILTLDDMSLSRAIMNNGLFWIS